MCTEYRAFKITTYFKVRMNGFDRAQGITCGKEIKDRRSTRAVLVSAKLYFISRDIPKLPVSKL